MGSKHINIVSFDVPFPPDYGGVIDVFYKIKALQEAGIKVHLHCFQYGRTASEELERMCTEVHYYPRKVFGNLFNMRLPYIVKTRKSNELLKNLLLNDYPILFEGLHCTFYLNHDALKGRQTFVRMHNIEYVYYKHLAKVEKNRFKRIYFDVEANRLRNFQQKLSLADYVAAISPSDHKILDLKHGNSFYLPVFHQNEKISSITGKGDYILYHGNLGVGENNEAAIFLVSEVINDLKLPTIIAGNNPSPELKKLVHENYHVKLINPDHSELNDLIKNAHINILPTFQDTGIKLKLLNALFQGRHTLVNNKMVKDTGLQEICYIANHPKSFKNMISKLYEEEFTYDDILKRKEILLGKFNNTHNIKILIDKLV